MLWSYGIVSLAFAASCLLHSVAAVPSATIPLKRGSLLNDWTKSRDARAGSSWSLEGYVPQQLWKFTGGLVKQDARRKQTEKAAMVRSLLAQYKDEVVLRFTVASRRESEELAQALETLFLDVWGSAEDWTDVRLRKDIIPSLLSLIPHGLKQQPRLLMDETDLAYATANTYGQGAHLTSGLCYDCDSEISRANLNHGTQPLADVFFQSFQPLDTLEAWMRLLVSMYPDMSELISVGKTYEGRDIYALKVGRRSGAAAADPRKTIVISGGAHAREWISTSTVSYLAYSWLTNYGSSHKLQPLINDMDWIFIPTLNPDGYQYTFTRNRLWRKTRQPTSLRFCNGIDLDHAWPFKWGGQKQLENPCSNNFAGNGSLDAVEASTFSEWIKNATSNNVEIAGMLDFHSYSQQIEFPYSYSCDEEPALLENLEELAYDLSRKIWHKSREDYKVVPACQGNVLADGSVLPKVHGSGGSFMDWFYAELGVRWTLQIKLRDTGMYGFLLPENYIIPTGEEMVKAVKYFGHRVHKGLPKEPGDL